MPSSGFKTIFSIFSLLNISSISSREFVTFENGIKLGKFRIISFSLFSLSALAGLMQSTPEISSNWVKYKYSLLNGGLSLLMTYLNSLILMCSVLLFSKLNSPGLGNCIFVQLA